MPGVKAGPPTLLSSSEEDDLVKFLLTSADIGYGRTRGKVLNMVTQLLAWKGVECVLSSVWWNKFLCQHPQLRIQTPATLSVSRARASTRECVDAYFDCLEITLHETWLSDYPAKRKTMAPEMAIGEIPGTHYVFSENGWINSILFDYWFKKMFMRYAPAFDFVYGWTQLTLSSWYPL